jgi:hypothetical protein
MLRRMRRLQQISGESLETRQSCPCSGAEHSPTSRHAGRGRQAAGPGEARTHLVLAGSCHNFVSIGAAAAASALPWVVRPIRRHAAAG